MIGNIEMGKQRKKTRKELEHIIGGLAYAVEVLKNHVAGLEGYLQAFIRWDGKELAFKGYLEENFKKQEEEIGRKGNKQGT